MQYFAAASSGGAENDEALQSGTLHAPQRRCCILNASSCIRTLCCYNNLLLHKVIGGADARLESTDCPAISGCPSSATLQTTMQHDYRSPRFGTIVKPSNRVCRCCTVTSGWAGSRCCRQQRRTTVMLCTWVRIFHTFQLTHCPNSDWPVCDMPDSPETNWSRREPKPTKNELHLDWFFSHRGNKRGHPGAGAVGARASTDSQEKTKVKAIPFNLILPLTQAPTRTPWSRRTPRSRPRCTSSSATPCGSLVRHPNALL